MRALDLNGIVRYVPEADRTPGPDGKLPERPTTFLLKVPSEADMRAIENAMEAWYELGTLRRQHHMADAIHEALDRDLAGWEDFQHPKTGAAIEYPKGDQQAAMDLIPHRTRAELFAKVRELGALPPPMPGSSA